MFYPFITKAPFIRVMGAHFSCCIILVKFVHAVMLFMFLQKKYSYLDVVGRTVVVLEKKNVVPEHNVPFQVTSQCSKHDWPMY